MDTIYDKYYTQLGLNIMYYRRAAGMTQELLAEKLNISRQHIQRIETAHAAPSLELVFQLASVLNVEPHKLFQSRE